MIRSEELRLNNILAGGTVTALVGSTVWINGKPMLQDELAGVELTEELLIKCGFIEIYRSSFRIKFEHPEYVELGYHINFTDNKKNATYFGLEIKCDTLHHLQNLTHSLTGTEPTIK